VTPVITRGDTILNFERSIRPHLNHPLVQMLLRNDELQFLLKEARYQTLIEGLHCMNKAGRKRRLENTEDEQMALTVLNLVMDYRDCLFLHPRENPAELCRGYDVGLPFDWKVVRHQDVARMYPGDRY
jgi:energy-converting hydrogenase A subunit M